MPVNLTEHLAAQETPLKAALSELVRIPSVCAEGRAATRSARPLIRRCGKPCGSPATWGSARTTATTGTTVTPRSEQATRCSASWGTWTSSRPANWRTGRPDRLIRLKRMAMLYGRGTQDDKGPLLAALFAVKALMDAGVKFNKRVRFIFGTDEETLWRCINRYKEKEELPGMGFSPDARFPLIFAEKGLLQLHLEGANRSGLRMAGGSAFNAVPDTMFYEGERQDDLARKLDALGFAYTRKDEWHRDSRQSRPCDDPGGRHQRHRPPVHCTARDRHRIESDRFHRPGNRGGSQRHAHLWRVRR